MRQDYQQLSSVSQFSRSTAALRSDAFVPESAYANAESWEKSWSREAAPSASVLASAWWTATDEGYVLLQRLALAHLLVGICAMIVLLWQTWNASAPTLEPAIGLVVAIGGALALVLSRLDRSAFIPGARLALLAVDMGAASGILWLRGGAGWVLLVFLPAITLAIAFFAERGGALATALSALIMVAVNSLGGAPLTEWAPSILVFLATAGLIVAFLSIYSAHITEATENLRWLLSDAQVSNDQLRQTRQTLLMRLRSLEQAQEPLLHERTRLGDAAADLVMLTQRVIQGDQAAVRILQTLRPGAYGPLGALASALSRLVRASAESWNPPAAALDMPVRAQGQALAALDTTARSLCVGANELVREAEALAPTVSVMDSEQYAQALARLEQRLRAQATQMAWLGTQLADIRGAQENLEAAMTRAAASARTPASFATSDIRAVSLYSGPQVTFGASAIRRAAISREGENETVRWGNWRNPPSVTYNRDV